MGIFSLKFTALTTGASANAFVTLFALKFANTAGHRAKLRKLFIGGGGGAVQDVQVDIKIDRTDNSTDGTSTTVATTLILAHDQDGVASNMSAIGKNHSVEPTAYLGDTGAGGAFNSRGGMLLEWGPGQGPGWGKAQTLSVLGAPGAATATLLIGMVEWEE